MTGFDFVKNWDTNTIADTTISSLLGIIGHLFLDGCFPVLPWVAFMIIGMWVGRRDLSDRSLRKKNVLMGCVAVVLAESVSRVLIHISLWAQFDLKGLMPWFEIAAWNPTPFFMLSAMGTALVVIGVIMIFADRYGNTRWISPFISVGQTTLTLYVAHIIVGIFLLRVIETLELEYALSPIWWAAIFYTGALLLSYYWIKRFPKGPLELLMRRFLVFSGPSRIPSPDIGKAKDFPILVG
jgi:uncharacterized membrane protein YeiB